VIRAQAISTPGSSTDATSCCRASPFKLSKSIDDDLRPLSLNVAFKRLSGPGGAEEDFDESFIQGVAFNGNQTAPITVRPKAVTLAIRRNHVPTC
jgi:hypothetical protein